MKHIAQPWHAIVEIAKWAPTPHNTQAYQLAVVDEHAAYIYADTARSIPATDPDGQFLYVGLGIFIENMRLCAADQGYLLEFSETEGSPRAGHKPLGMFTLTTSVQKPDIDISLIQKRRTSRLPFDGVPVPAAVKAELTTEAKRYKQELGFSDDAADIAAVLRFNTKILFYDLNHTALRRELIEWIRWTTKQYETKRDGFSIPSLNQKAPLMWTFLHSAWLLKMPLSRTWIQRRYERAISNVGTIGWIKGPFAGQAEWIKAGEVLARLWLKSTGHDLYLHPFGSVITNQEARSWALKQLKLTEEPGEMCWLLFRIGTGPVPPRSLRHETEEYFI